MEEVKDVEEEKLEEVAEEQENEQPEQKEDDRSVENLKAENRRKAEEIAALREKVDHATRGYNPNDMSTWDDKQLQAVAVAPDVQPQFKLQAQDILLDRKVERRMAAQKEKEMRESFELRRMEEFPETFDNGSPMTTRMNRILKEYSLDNSPAGRYAAAKIALSEMKRPSRDVKREVASERERVAGIKASKTSRDVPGRGAPQPGRSAEELTKRAGHNDDAFMELLRQRGGGKAKGVIHPLN